MPHPADQNYRFLDSKSRAHVSLAGLSHSPIANVLCMPLWVTLVETFWRKLQEIIPCRTIQKRSATWDNKSVQMVQFPTLEECKAAFREHMADPKWAFDSDAAADATAEDSPPFATRGNDQAVVRASGGHTQEEWDAMLARMRDSL